MKATLDKEIWVNIQGEDYNGRYQVSTHGRVKNDKDKILKFYIVNGYYKVDLSFKDKPGRKKWRVHRLIGDHLISKPQRNEELFINHIDGNKLNNHISNLEWVTHSENATHAQLNKKRYSSYPGVSKDTSKKNRTKIWYARGYLNSKAVYLGSYLTEEEAINARKQFDLENGYINKYAEHESNIRI